MSKLSKAAYIERVRRAMQTDSKEMTRGEYIDALEQISEEIETNLDAAREEERLDL